MPGICVQVVSNHVTFTFIKHFKPTEVKQRAYQDESTASIQHTHYIILISLNLNKVYLIN